MPTSRLPLDIKKFLTDTFETVSQLDVLFLIYEHPEKTWSADSLSREMRSHPTAVSRQAQFLVNHGFIQALPNNQFIYNKDTDKHEIVKRIHDLYHDMPVAVIACIYEKPQDMLKGFADAFKLKKD